jgi:hypothetical protein
MLNLAFLAIFLVVDLEREVNAVTQLYKLGNPLLLS